MSQTAAASTDPRVTRMVEAYLRGLHQGGHPPLSTDEIAEMARVAAARLASH